MKSKQKYEIITRLKNSAIFWKNNIIKALISINGILDVKIYDDGYGHLKIFIYTSDENLFGKIQICDIENEIERIIPAGILYTIHKSKFKEKEL